MTASNPSSAQNRPGHPTEIAGRYRILDKIAEGGMGVVYRAEHVLSKKRLALKLLYPHLCHGPQAVERFRREVSAAAEIDHPGIVQVFDAGVDGDGSFYMAMELLEGDSLAAAMRKDWPTTHRAVEIVREVLGPLARAHERGFVHRDLKPENLFLAKQPGTDIVAVKLLDFGLTREVQRKGPTLTGVTFGTPEYMSPEQCMSAKKAGTASDVWAIGVILYELLTGYYPFSGETPNAIMVSSIKDPHIPVATRSPHVPQALAKVIERCLEKEPDRRPQTAGELGDLLERALADATLTDTKPARTHYDDEPVEEPADNVSLDGIPIGGSESTRGLRGGLRDSKTDTLAPASQRGVSTEPTAATIRLPISGAMLGAGLLALLVLGVGGAFALTRILSPYPVEPTATELRVAPPSPVAAPVSPPVEPVVETPIEVTPEPALSAETPIEEELSPEPEVETAVDTPGARRERARPEAPAVAPSGAELSPEQYTTAQACLARGDRACAISILRESRRPRDLARVIDLYELEGRSREASAAMQSFVRRFPSASETARYRSELDRRGL